MISEKELDRIETMKTVVPSILTVRNLIAEIRRLREKLSWYGDEENYYRAESKGEIYTQVTDDKGQRAREALK